jgi:transposase
MRACFNGLAAKVEPVLADDPFSGHAVVVRYLRHALTCIADYPLNRLGELPP